MITFFNFNLSTEQLFLKQVQKVYGINKNTAMYLCKFFGIHPFSKINTLSHEELIKIFNFLENFFFLDVDLKKKNFSFYYKSLNKQNFNSFKLKKKIKND